MILTLSNERLRELIPNIIHEVKGETPLLAKLQPWLDSAKAWLEENFLGPDFEPGGQILSLLEKIIAHKAFAMAVPMLDITLSPAGFAVINTEGRAPASKERIERLLASLQKSIDSALNQLVVSLYAYEQWRESPMGLWWLATFLPNLNEVFRFREPGADLMESYRSMRSIALRFEQEVEAEYLGSLLAELRAVQYFSSDKLPLVAMIRRAELIYIEHHLFVRNPKCPDEHELWHLIRPVIEQLNLYPALFERWHAEMGDKFSPEQFKNNIKGGYYF